MNLRKFDNQCVRIEDIYGDVYEGICEFNYRDYNMHEYGVDEDSLVMAYIIFYRSFIKKVESLEEHEGPYGKFTCKYGKLEEVIMDSDLDIMEEVFDSEENISIYRLLCYLEDHISFCLKQDRETFLKLLDMLIQNNNNAEIIEKAKNIRNQITK